MTTKSSPSKRKRNRERWNERWGARHDRLWDTMANAIVPGVTHAEGVDRVIQRILLIRTDGVLTCGPPVPKRRVVEEHLAQPTDPRYEALLSCGHVVTRSRRRDLEDDARGQPRASGCSSCHHILRDAQDFLRRPGLPDGPREETKS